MTGVPIKFVGISEKPDGIEQFHPDRQADAIVSFWRHIQALGRR